MKTMIIEENGMILVCGPRKKGIMTGVINEIDIEVKYGSHKLRVYGSGTLVGVTRKELDDLEVLRTTPIDVLIALAKQYQEVIKQENKNLIATQNPKAIT